MKVRGTLLLPMIALWAGCLGRTPANRLVLPPASDRWTKELRVYDALDLNLEGYVTYHSLELRERAIAQKVLDFHLPEKEVEALRDAARKEWEGDADFYLAAFTPKRAWNDFDRRDSHWRVYLLGPEGKRIEPDQVRKTSAAQPDESRPPEEWSKVYLVRFKRPVDAEKKPIKDEVLIDQYRLVITGPLGEVALKW